MKTISLFLVLCLVFQGIFSSVAEASIWQQRRDLMNQKKLTVSDSSSSQKYPNNAQKLEEECGVFVPEQLGKIVDFYSPEQK